MATSLTAATLTVTLTEAITINGINQGGTNTLSISSIKNVSKRIVTVPTSEVTLLNFGTAVAAGQFDESKVRYIRVTNKDGANHLYLVFKNEYNNEFCIKLDKGQSFIYNGDAVSGVIDTMLANQIALGFTDITGDVGTGDSFIDNITANGGIIPGLRVSNDSGYVPANTSVGAITSTNAGVSAATSHTLVTRNATTGAESVSEGTGVDNDGPNTYAAGFGDLVEITAEADTAEIDVEVFVATI